ncbi:hypothetical protein BLA50215_07779 [Burkholderia lata]|nr:hypothetical protein BLA50215_07779 [Burkholderia lata]
MIKNSNAYEKCNGENVVTISATDSQLFLLGFGWIRRSADRPDLSARDCRLIQHVVVDPNAPLDSVYHRDAYGAVIPDGITGHKHFCAQTCEVVCDPVVLFSVREWPETVGKGRDAAFLCRTLCDWLCQEASLIWDERARWRTGQVAKRDAWVDAHPEVDEEIVLFVHCETQEDLAPFQYGYADALVGQVVRLLFPCRDRTLSGAARQQLAKLVWRIVQTGKCTTELGGGRARVLLLDATSLTARLVIRVSDHVVGEMNNLAPFFARVHAGGADLTGAIDGQWHEMYVRDFFLHRSARLVQLDVWCDFWGAWWSHRDANCRFNSCEFGFQCLIHVRGVMTQPVWQVYAIVHVADFMRTAAWLSNLGAGLMRERWDVMLVHIFPYVDHLVFTARPDASLLVYMTRAPQAHRANGIACTTRSRACHATVRPLLLSDRRR